MKFRTQVNIKEAQNKISYKSKCLFLGSCFVENIGQKMKELAFDVCVNPFGVLYNPTSIKNGLEILLAEKRFKAKDLDFYNGQWFSFYHNTFFSSEDKETCLQSINKSIEKGSEYLKKGDFLFITLGTSQVYQHRKKGITVSNCHKLPANEFERKRLTADEIVIEYIGLLNKILNLNPNIKFIFTVSPVRHWKDGANKNQLSKAILLLAIDKLTSIYEDATYFPAYEIVMDELRDYRFYSEDMLHINKIGVKYIWQQFAHNFITPKSQNIISKIEKIVKAIQHKAFNPNSQQHQEFKNQLTEKIKGLEKEYPFLNLSRLIR